MKNKLNVVEAISDSRPVVMFVARGHPGNRWYKNSSGDMVLKDEYAENIPEALVEICNVLNWRLIVFFAGRSPDFDDQKLTYSQKYPTVATQMEFSDFGLKISKRKEEVLRETRDNFSSFSESAEFKSLFSYKGVNFDDHITEKLNKDIPALSANMKTVHELWSEIFKKTKPNIIIGGRLDVMPYLVSAAKSKGIYTCNIKLGVGEEMLFPFAVKNKKGDFEESIAPNLTILWGTEQKSLIEKRFPDYPSELVVSGRTRNDSFKEPVTSDELAEVRDSLGLLEDETIILFGGNNRTFFGMGDGEDSGTCCLSPYSLKAAIETLSEYAANYGSCKVIVKPHPVDDTQLIESICDRFDNVIFIDPIGAAHNSVLLSLSKFFVSSASSMFTEAIAAGSLPINLWINDVNYLYEVERKNVWGNLSITVESISELPTAIDSFLSDEDLRRKTCDELSKKLPSYAGHTDGLNSVRAVELSFTAYAKEYEDYKLEKQIKEWTTSLGLRDYS